MTEQGVNESAGVGGRARSRGASEGRMRATVTCGRKCRRRPSVARLEPEAAAGSRSQTAASAPCSASSARSGVSCSSTASARGWRGGSHSGAPKESSPTGGASAQAAARASPSASISPTGRLPRKQSVTCRESGASSRNWRVGEDRASRRRLGGRPPRRAIARRARRGGGVGGFSFPHARCGGARPAEQPPAQLGGQVERDEQPGFGAAGHANDDRNRRPTTNDPRGRCTAILLEQAGGDVGYVRPAPPRGRIRIRGEEVTIRSLYGCPRKKSVGARRSYKRTVADRHVYCLIRTIPKRP